jgi:hypothetical protein
MQDLSHMMHWLQGTFATDCNRRRQREGAFWRGRFHPTLVQRPWLRKLLGDNEQALCHMASAALRVFGCAKSVDGP